MDNNNLERPNYMGWLPAEVRYADISASAKLLYVEITSLVNKTGTCWASNKYFANLYNASADSVSRWVKELIDAGFIESQIVKEAGNRRYLRLSEKITIPIGKNTDTYRQKSNFTNREDDSSANNKKENNKTKKLESDLLSLVNSITGRNFRTLPRGAKKTLDLFSLEEIEAALTAMAADGWHRPKLKELSIDYFLRATTIDRFKDQKTSKLPADFTGEDDDGNSYYKGELVTPQNQARITRERMGGDGTN